MMELLVALSIMGIIAAGMQASIFVTLRGIPSAQGPAQTALAANKIADQIATELENAIYVTEHTATTLGFTVPDRNQDGSVERIRYAWTGTSGGALTRQFNGGTPVTLASSVNLLSLTPTYKSVAETYPTVCVEDASESVLVDKSGTSGLNSQSETATNWFGQYYTYTLPAGAYAWRPTRVDYQAMKGSSPGQSAVEMHRSTATSVPDTKLLDTSADLTDGMLGNSFGWTTANFANLPPCASNNGVCFVLRYKAGLFSSAIVESTSSGPGLLKTSLGGSSWQYDGSQCLNSKLYGKLLRSSGNQTINSNYLTSMNISLQIAVSSPTLKTMAPLLNHPEMLSGKWELKFDQNPTTVDINGDAAGDWVVNGGGSFNTSTLSGNVWHTSGTQLNTSPNCDFAKTTVVDLTLQNTSTGGNGATFYVNALRSGSSCAPVGVNVTLEADGTQSLLVYTKTDDATTKKLFNSFGLPAQPLALHLVIDPTTSSVGINVNNVTQGTYALKTFSSSDSSRYASIGTSGSNSEFSYVRLRVME